MGLRRGTASSGAAAAGQPSLSALYRDLLALFPEDRQGFGLDPLQNLDGQPLITDHQPMTYGFVLSAEARHFRFDRNAESGRRVRKAVRWLIDNRDLDGDGKPGWGLPQAWPAWGHAPNPHNQPYTITTAIVLNGMLDALSIRDFWSAAERDEMLDFMVQVARRWCRELWTEGYGGGYFWYSPSPADDIFGVNAPTMFLGSLARLLRDYGGRFTEADRKLVRHAATRWPGPSSIRCSCTTGSRSGSTAAAEQTEPPAFRRPHAPCLHAVGHRGIS